MRESIYFSTNNKPGSKRKWLFDETMGAYDGAEVCDPVGIFILYQLSGKYNKNNIGLYRDGGLVVFKNISGQKQKKLRNIFRT